MKTCEYGVYNPRTRDVDPCGKKCEGDTDYCGSHNRLMRKQETDSSRESEKRAQQIAQKKAKNSLPRKTISKNPKDWSNTFLCSDGTRVTQAQINENLRRHYSVNGKNVVCEGCRKATTSHAQVLKFWENGYYETERQESVSEIED